MMNINKFKNSIAIAFLAGFLFIGTSANAFQLQTMDDQRINLMDYVSKDSFTLVMFWTTDCVMCEEQKPMLEAFHKKLSPAVANVVGVALDGVEHKEEIEAINNNHKSSYPNLMAFSDVFHRQYNELTGKTFRASPTFLVFDDNGNMLGNLYGYLDFKSLESLMLSSFQPNN